MKILPILPIIVLILIIFFVKYTLSLSNDFTTEKTCTLTFNQSCSVNTLNDSFLGCIGAQNSATCYVGEVHINQTTFLINSGILARCDFYHSADSNSTEQIWYYNSSAWYNLYNQTHNRTSQTGLGYNNVSINFTLNFSVGVHIIRCIVDCVNGNDNPVPQITGECANSTYTTATKYDNDDVNFTVTDYPKYSNWNINISDYSSQTRSNVILAYAHWDKDLNNANITHNGTGSFQNYTVSISDNWTNYTLDLSNTTQFNITGPIEISYIWANDTFGLENYT